MKTISIITVGDRFLQLRVSAGFTLRLPRRKKDVDQSEDFRDGQTETEGALTERYI